MKITKKYHQQTRTLTYQLVLLLSILVIYSHTAYSRESICAQVKIEIRQEASLERQAFDAVMKIHNGLETAPLKKVGITVKFTDDKNNTVLASSDPNNTAAQFFIKVSSMDGISNVNGNGDVQPDSSAEIHWLIIPAPGSGGSIPSGKAYNVGATLTYTLGSDVQEVTVIPDVIYVKPLPAITLDYFLTRDVIADDPFTDNIVEASEPFTLGVRVSNNGEALAKHFKIDSAQPRIVENEQGLLINFNIVSSFIDNKPVAPDLLLDFGDIEGKSARIGRWQMMTSLSGKFTEFTATWSHADELGGQLTSIMEDVRTHFLVHDVQVDLPGRDDVNDFLALDDEQLRVYESENVDTIVNSQTDDITLTPGTSSNNQDYYQLTIPQSTGFIHTKTQVSQALANGKAISRMLRSDNKVLKPANVWFSKEGDGAKGWTYYLNLFDYNSTGRYQLVLGQKIMTGQPPAITFIPLQTTETQKSFSLTIHAADPDNTIPMLSALNLPGGAGFVDQGNGTGQLNWIPALNQAGQHTITFEAKDGTHTTQRKASISVALVTDADSDNDGMDDQWELEHFGTLERDGLGDYDNDGKIDRDEFNDNTDPAEFNMAGLPQINTPAIGSETNQLAPALSIDNASHDADTQVAYQFQLYHDESLTQLLEKSPVINETDNQTHWTPEYVFSDNTWYTWRVRAQYAGNYSQWVAGYFFVNTRNDVPTVPAILSPADGTQISTLNPVFEITPARDIDGDKLQYRFILYEDNSKTNIIDRLDNFTPTDSSIIKWFMTTPLINGHQYYWEAVIDDGEGGEVHTELATFTVDTNNQSPGMPLLIEPAVNSTLSATDMDIILGNSMDPEYDALTYYFELDKQKDFNSPDKQQTTQPSGDIRTTWSLHDLTDNTQYYWRARAFDGNSYSIWIRGSFFINIENDTPEVPVIANPGDQTWVTTPRPVLQIIKADDKDGDAVSYEYELYADKTMNILVLSNASQRLNWPTDTYLADNTWYYWRVRSIDEQGASSHWSILTSFFINNNGKDDAPAITLLTPAETVTVENSYIIRWSDEDPDSNALINLYFGQSDRLSESSLIAENLEENSIASEDSYTFDTSQLEAGEYYIMATISDDSATVTSTAPGKLIKINTTPELVLNYDQSTQITAGTPVALSVSVTNYPQLNYEYRFLQKNNDGQSHILQDWSTESGYDWDTSTLQGTVIIRAEARQQNSTGNTGAVGSTEQAFTITEPEQPSTTAVQLTSTVVSPQQQGELITLQAQAEGGSGEYEYHYQIKGDVTTGQWLTLDNGQWSEKTALIWDTTNYPGTSELKVSARNKDSMDTPVTASLPFTIQAKNARVRLSANTGSSINQGTPVLLTASTNTSTVHYNYRFRIKGKNNGYRYQILQDWSDNKQLNWDSSSYKGGYTLQVQQRVNGRRKIHSRAKLWFNVISSIEPPASSVTLISKKTSPQKQGRKIKLIARGDGGSGYYEYRFMIKGEATLNKWVALNNWKNKGKIKWNTKRYPGQNTLQVQVRNRGSLDVPVTKEMVFTITPKRAVVILQSDMPTTIRAGDRVNLTAHVFGGSDTYEYRYRIKGRSTNRKNTLLKDWSLNSQYQWDSSLIVNKIRITVDIRKQGNMYITDTNSLWFKVAGQ